MRLLLLPKVRWRRGALAIALIAVLSAGVAVATETASHKKAAGQAYEVVLPLSPGGGSSSNSNTTNATTSGGGGGTGNAAPAASASTTISPNSGDTVAITVNNTPLGTVTVTAPNLGAGVTLTVTVYSNGKVVVQASSPGAADHHNIQVCASMCQTVGFDPGTGTAQAQF